MRSESESGQAGEEDLGVHQVVARSDHVGFGRGKGDLRVRALKGAGLADFVAVRDDVVVLPCGIQCRFGDGERLARPVGRETGGKTVFSVSR